MAAAAGLSSTSVVMFSPNMRPKKSRSASDPVDSPPNPISAPSRSSSTRVLSEATALLSQAGSDVGYKRHQAAASDIGSASLVLPLLGVQILTMAIYWLLDAKYWEKKLTYVEAGALISLAAAAATSCFTTVFSVLEVHYMMLVGGIHITDNDEEAQQLQKAIGSAYNRFNALRMAARNSLWASVAFLCLAAFFRIFQAGGLHGYDAALKAGLGCILLLGVGSMAHAVAMFREAYIPLLTEFG